MNFDIRGKRQSSRWCERNQEKHCRGFAKAGADVAIVDIDIDEAKKTAEKIKQAGVKVIAIKTDVTSPIRFRLWCEK